MNRFQFHAAALSAVLLLGCGPAAGQQSTLQGVFVTEAQSDAAVAKAIDAAVAKMNFITRSVARGRLKKTNPAYKRIEIVQTPAEISVRFDERKPVVMPADGTSIKWTREDGEKFDVTASMDAGQLVQTFKAEDGQRVNRFSPGPDANTLILYVTVSSEQLPAPVNYQLTFQRGPAG